MGVFRPVLAPAFERVGHILGFFLRLFGGTLVLVERHANLGCTPGILLRLEVFAFLIVPLCYFHHFIHGFFLQILLHLVQIGIGEFHFGRLSRGPPADSFLHLLGALGGLCGHFGIHGRVFGDLLFLSRWTGCSIGRSSAVASSFNVLHEIKLFNLGANILGNGHDRLARYRGIILIHPVESGFHIVASSSLARHPVGVLHGRHTRID